MASLWVLPLAVRRSRKRRAGGWLLAWVRAMRWTAALSWRLPARLRRCLWVLANHTGSGAVPEWRANACREWNRSMPAVSPMGRGPPRPILGSISEAPRPNLGSISGAVARRDAF